MRPGGQPRKTTVIGKPSKTIGYSDISRSRAPWGREKTFGDDDSVSQFVVGGPRIAYGIHSKPLENVAFPSTLAGTRGTAGNLGVADRRWPKESSALGFAVYGSTKLIPRHAICIPRPASAVCVCSLCLRGEKRGMRFQAAESACTCSLCLQFMFAG